MTQTITPHSAPAIWSHQTMSRMAFRTYLAEVFGRRGQRGVTLKGYYRHVEYMNAADGLIVLAHRFADGQVDGIHPVALSSHLTHWTNIVEPFGKPVSGYAMHYLSRRQQGRLVHGAFGRMIHPGDNAAPSFMVEHGSLTLELFDGPDCPIVGVVDDGQVHVIRPVSPIAIETV